jgi:hypothetical protein
MQTETGQKTFSPALDLPSTLSRTLNL